MKQLFTVVLSIFTFITYGQVPAIQGALSLGGSSDDYAKCIQQTTDGGYIVAGYTTSNNGDVSGNHGGRDSWIVKLNNIGVIEWQKCLGGSNDDYANSIQQTTDGGYIVAGSNSGIVSGNHGRSDYWIVKLNNIGDIDWQKSLGGSDYDNANSIQQTTDGGYIVAGVTGSNDGDVSGNHGGSDYWIVKLNNLGVIEWQKCLGGSITDYATSIQQTTNGGYIVAGYSNSNSGNVSGNHGNTDYWIVKLTKTGAIQSQKCIGGSFDDFATSIQQTTDGGYIVAGYSTSNDGDVSGNHGGTDYWIVKLNKTGAIQSQKCLGGSDYDFATSIQQTTNGSYIVAGYTDSNDGDVSGNHGRSDYWIVKLNNIGVIEWQKCLGGSSLDIANSIQQTTDGDYIVVGYSGSKDGDVSGNRGRADYWIVKLNKTGALQNQNFLGGSEPSASGNIVSQVPIANADNALGLKLSSSNITLSPNPVHSTLHISGLSSTLNNELSIINESGVALKSIKLKGSASYEVDISMLPAGVYFLVVGDDKLKFIKQ